MSTPITVPGGSKEIPEGIEDVTKESSRPGSPLPEPGTIKTKLAFFESLKTKFSSKWSRWLESDAIEDVGVNEQNV